MKFSKKQLEKMTDQIRLLFWGQGAILIEEANHDY